MFPNPSSRAAGFAGPVPTAAQRLETLLEPIRHHPFRDAAERRLWGSCLERLATPRPVLDLADFPSGLVALLQPAWIRAHAAMAVDSGVVVHGVRLPPGLRHLPGWLAALPRLQRLELLDCQASHLDVRGLGSLRQLRLHGPHRLRRIDLPELTSIWVDPGPFDIRLHAHGPVVSTLRLLPARAAVPEAVHVHPDPGDGVDERANLNQQVRSGAGRPLNCGDLVSLWLNDRSLHHARVCRGEARPEAFDYRRLGTPAALQARTVEAAALRERLRHPARPVHLVADSRSGAWLRHRMDAMAAAGRTSSHYWLGSLHHAMALELAIETDAQTVGGPSVPRWRVRLYDPNHTTLHLEWFSHDRTALERLRLSHLGHALVTGPAGHASHQTDPLWRLYPVDAVLATDPAGPVPDDAHEDWLPEGPLLSPECVGQLFKAGRHGLWQGALRRLHERRRDPALTLAFVEARDAQGRSLLMRSPMSADAVSAYTGVLLSLGLQGLPLALTLVRAFGSELDRPDEVLHGLLAGRPPRLPVFLQALGQLRMASADLVTVLRPPPRAVPDGWTMPLHEVLAEGRSAVLSAWMLGLRQLRDEALLGLDDVAAVLDLRRRTLGGEISGLAVARERGHAEVLAVWSAGLRSLGLKESGLPWVGVSRP